ncbi:histone-lysine_N-methyltransferase 2A-like isoform X2 [Hexamita inflata]|uniref:Histone-lysine_N-methyltransferase 2A-like isoform X2 n=1 Tax=Hexamita inflata TaxID=28002 RepID=A0ABP1IKT8_9EUKA
MIKQFIKFHHGSKERNQLNEVIEQFDKINKTNIKYLLYSEEIQCDENLTLFSDYKTINLEILNEILENSSKVTKQYMISPSYHQVLNIYLGYMEIQPFTNIQAWEIDYLKLQKQFQPNVVIKHNLIFEQKQICSNVTIQDATVPILVSIQQMNQDIQECPYNIKIYCSESRIKDKFDCSIPSQNTIIEQKQKIEIDPSFLEQIEEEKQINLQLEQKEYERLQQIKTEQVEQQIIPPNPELNNENINLEKQKEPIPQNSIENKVQAKELEQPKEQTEQIIKQSAKPEENTKKSETNTLLQSPFKPESKQKEKQSLETSQKQIETKLIQSPFKETETKPEQKSKQNELFFELSEDEPITLIKSPLKPENKKQNEKVETKTKLIQSPFEQNKQNPKQNEDFSDSLEFNNSIDNQKSNKPNIETPKQKGQIQNPFEQTEPKTAEKKKKSPKISNPFEEPKENTPKKKLLSNPFEDKPQKDNKRQRNEYVENDKDVMELGDLDDFLF